MESPVNPALRIAVVAGAGLAFLLLPVSCSTRPSGDRVLVDPPRMAPRELAPPATPEPGERLALTVPGLACGLFLPEGWQKAPADRLALHFHTAEWFAIAEHGRSGQRFPLVSIFLGSGSARYREPFRDPARFGNLLGCVEQELTRRRGRAVRITAVDVSSFSAGYGAVRELVQQPAAAARIRRIVLSDSLYGGLADGTLEDGRRVVEPAHILCWLPFAREAIASRKTFVLTHTQIETPAYASTAECAAALTAALAVPRTVPSPGDPAGQASAFPLLRRADAGRFHVWSYAGTNAAAHLAHARHLADVWRALDAAESGGRPRRD